jgi:hypothetical protein
MIGGNARHAGKTSLACGLIRKFSAQFPVIGLKVTSVKAGESKFHGDHSNDSDDPWSVFEETDFHGEKDTSQMLRAGAHKVYFIRSSGATLMEAWSHFTTRVDTSSCLIICESRSLRNLLKPGLFLLMIRNADPGSGKDMTEYMELADEVCYLGNDVYEINEIVDRIKIIGNTWTLDIMNK